MKRIDLQRSVYDLTEEYPELVEILAGLGFLGVKNPLARKTLGKITTIPEGCRKQGIDLDEVLTKFIEHGFEIIGRER